MKNIPLRQPVLAAPSDQSFCLQDIKPALPPRRFRVNNRPTLLSSAAAILVCGQHYVFPIWPRKPALLS